MRYNVKVITQAKKNLVKEEGDSLKVYLTVPAIEGKANKALVEILADFFKVKKRQVEITKGLKSHNKTITILEIS